MLANRLSECAKKCGREKEKNRLSVAFFPFFLFVRRRFLSQFCLLFPVWFWLLFVCVFFLAASLPFFFPRGFSCFFFSCRVVVFLFFHWLL